MSIRTEVSIHYRQGHTIYFKYELTDLYCLKCGKKTLWVETGGADYYEGFRHACGSCGTWFNLPSDPGDAAKGDDTDKQLFEQLRHATESLPAGSG